MKRIIFLVICGAIFCSFLSCARKEQLHEVPATGLPIFQATSEANKAPSDWNGPKFELSQDYPKAKPAEENYPWIKTNFVEHPREYLSQILQYVYEGNIEVDWAVQKNSIRHWFHAPWMHAPEIKKKLGKICNDEKGREFVHGLTRERTTSLAELNFGKDTTSCTPNIENWAVSVYNAPGGYVIRQVWEEMTIQQTTRSRLPVPEKFPNDFPAGSVVVKLLFTAATPEEVPYLAGSPEWRADTKRTGKPVILRLLQIDVAVRDPRAEIDRNLRTASGWVFGTFVYDKDARALFEDGKDVTLAWRKVKPIGLTFGNESEQTILVDPTINQSQHLGCQQRLVGPVDNPGSSCLACHSQAEVRAGNQPFAIINYDAKPFKRYNQCRCKADVDHWFRTIGPKEAFTQGAVSLGFSLQLSNGIIRFCQQFPDACPPIRDLPLAKDSEGPCPAEQLTAPPGCLLSQNGTGDQCEPVVNPLALSTFMDSFSVEASRGGDVEDPVVPLPAKKKKN